MVMSQRLASIGIGLSAIVVAGFLFASPAPAYAACVIETAQDVWLYSKDNCEGSTKSLVESTKSISNFNDKATSLKIQGDISAFFYERDEFGGKSICWNGRQPINRLDDYKITPTNGWAFDISSVEIKQAGACTNEGQTIAPIDGDDCGGGIGGVVCNAKKFVSGIRNAYIGIPFLIILVPLWVVALLSETLVAALGGALIWIAQRAIEIPVIPQAGNEFVQQGLAFSQGIVQGLFAFILVFIGFATILRLQTYQLQRTLPLLIIVALLINFSPVLVGFVVDMGNILTNFFLSAQQVQSWKAIPQTAGDMGNDIIEFVTTPGFGNALAKLVEIAVRNIVIVLFNTALLLVLFVVLLLFIVRTAVLWVLAILAPFAFAAYILPGTRRYWTQWWGQLIQWSLIGVPIGFSLYLASMSASYADKVLPVGGNLQGVSALIASIVGPFTTIIILGAGVAISMQLAPAAARGTINFGKKTPGMLANTKLGAKVMGGLSARTQKTLAGVAPLMKRLEDKSGAFKPLTQYATRPLGWTTTGLNRAVGGKLLEYAASKRKFQFPKNWEQMGLEERMEWATSRNLGSEDLVQYAAKMGKDITKPQGKKGEEFRKRILTARDKTAKIGYLQESVGTINDTMSETVTEQILIDTKIASGMSEADARKEVQEVMDTHKKKVTAAVSDDDLTVEAGIKLKYITREEVDADKDAALAKARTSLTQAQKDKFLSDTAAAMSYAKKIKPQDIANVADPKTLSFRLAMREGNPANLQRIMDNFDQATLQTIITGKGGLNDAADDPQKMRTLYKDNPRLVRALFTNPVLQGLDWKGRNQLLDIFDKPTGSFDAFVRRERAQEIAQGNPDLQKAHNLFKTLAQNQEKRRAVETDADADAIDEQIQSINDRLGVMKDDFLKTSPAQTRSWEELEGIMRVPSGAGARRGGSTGRRRGRRGGGQEEEYRGG